MSEFLKKSFYGKCLSAGVEIATNANVINDISLMSTTPEAMGHEIEIDEISIKTAFDCIVGKQLKSFNNHNWWAPPTDIIGVFSDFYTQEEDGVVKLKAKTFEFLESTDPEIKNKIIELARKCPDVFGTSIWGELKAVWVCDDGDEVESYDRPHNCSKQYRVARFSKVISVDFVSTPAANDTGLFSAKNPKTHEEIFTENQKKKEKNMNKKIKFFAAKFGDGTPQFGRAISKLFATEKPEDADENKIVDEVVDEDEAIKKDAELKALNDEVNELKTKLESCEKERDELKASLDESKAKEAELSAQFKQFGGAKIEPSTQQSNAPKVANKYADSFARIHKQFGGK